MTSIRSDETLRRARLAVILALLVVWVATLLWLALTTPTLTILCADAPPGRCSGMEEPAAARFYALFGPVFITGPLAVLAARAALTPAKDRTSAVLALLTVLWLCAPPALLMQSLMWDLQCAINEPGCSPAIAAGSRWAMVIAGCSFIAAPIVAASTVFRQGRQRAGAAWFVFAVFSGVFVAAIDLIT